jgi:hypothetical protein
LGPAAKAFIWVFAIGTAGGIIYLVVKRRRDDDQPADVGQVGSGLVYADPEDPQHAITKEEADRLAKEQADTKTSLALLAEQLKRQTNEALGRDAANTAKLTEVQGELDKQNAKRKAEEDAKAAADAISPLGKIWGLPDPGPGAFPNFDQYLVWLRARQAEAVKSHDVGAINGWWSIIDQRMREFGRA